MLTWAGFVTLQLGLFPLAAGVHLSQNRAVNDALSLPNGLTLHSSARPAGFGVDGGIRSGPMAAGSPYPGQANIRGSSGGLSPISGHTHVDMPGEHGNTSPYPVVHRQGGPPNSAVTGTTHVDMPGEHGNNLPYPVVHRPIAGRSPSRGRTHVDMPGEHGNHSPFPVVNRPRSGHSPHAGGTHVDLPGEHGNMSPFPIVHRHGNDHVSNPQVPRDFPVQQTNPVPFGMERREANVFGDGAGPGINAAPYPDVAPQMFNNPGPLTALQRTGPAARFPGMFPGGFGGGGAFPPPPPSTPPPMMTPPWAMGRMPFTQEPPFRTGIPGGFQGDVRGERFWRLPPHVRRRIRFRRRRRRRMRRRLETMRITLLLNSITQLLANM